MSIFRRIFKVAQAETHSVVDKLEDPIKMTEQGIRDLKRDLQAALASLAQVKSLAIRLKKDAEDQLKRSQDFERKAMLLLKKLQAGELEESKADSLATEALTKKEEASTRSRELKADYESQQKLADQLQAKVEKLKKTISRYENELITLKARAKTAESMRKINQQMSQVDSSGTIAMLEKMKTKVQEEEALAEAYGDISDASTSLDDEIEQAIGTPAATAANQSLADLKKKMGIEAGQ